MVLWGDLLGSTNDSGIAVHASKFDAVLVHNSVITLKLDEVKEIFKDHMADCSKETEILLNLESKSLDELKQLVNETTTTSGGTSSNSSLSTQAAAAGNNVNTKKRPLLSRPEVDSSKFKVVSISFILFLYASSHFNNPPYERLSILDDIDFFFGFS